MKKKSRKQKKNRQAGTPTKRELIENYYFMQDTPPPSATDSLAEQLERLGYPPLYICSM